MGGYFQVMLPSTGVDIVAVADVDECKASPCSTDATCTNNIGAGPTCTCKEGFVEVVSGGLTSCALKPEVYDSASQEYYFRLKHNDRLDYGWRVQELMMYSDPSCVSKYGFQGSISVPGNYPGPYTSARMLDNKQETEWWSEDLNLTRGEARSRERASCAIGCARHSARRSYSPAKARSQRAREAVLAVPATGHRRALQTKAAQG